MEGDVLLKYIHGRLNGLKSKSNYEAYPSLKVA